MVDGYPALGLCSCLTTFFKMRHARVSQRMRENPAFFWHMSEWCSRDRSVFLPAVCILDSFSIYSSQGGLGETEMRRTLLTLVLFFNSVRFYFPFQTSLHEVTWRNISLRFECSLIVFSSKQKCTLSEHILNTCIHDIWMVFE